MACRPTQLFNFLSISWSEAIKGVMDDYSHQFRQVCVLCAYQESYGKLTHQARMVLCSEDLVSGII